VSRFFRIKQAPFIVSCAEDSIQDIVHLPPKNSLVCFTIENGKSLVVAETSNNDKMRYIVRCIEGVENQNLAIGNVSFEVNWRSVERDGQSPDRLIRLIVELR
jgi:hypothetical protein